MMGKESRESMPIQSVELCEEGAGTRDRSAHLQVVEHGRTGKRKAYAERSAPCEWSSSGKEVGWMT